MLQSLTQSLVSEVYFNCRAVFFPSFSKVPPWGRFPPPSCPIRTTSPARRSTAASSVSTRASGKKRAAWWSSTTPCMRGRRASTSACPCPSGAVWESTTPPPKSRSWKTWTTVSLKADAVAGWSCLLTRCECFAQVADSDACLHARGFGVECAGLHGVTNAATLNGHRSLHFSEYLLIRHVYKLADCWGMKDNVSRQRLCSHGQI